MLLKHYTWYYKYQRCSQTGIPNGGWWWPYPEDSFWLPIGSKWQCDQRSHYMETGTGVFKVHQKRQAFLQILWWNLYLIQYRTQGFWILFLDKNNMPMAALHWEKYFQHIREKYNSIYKVQMPKVTSHVCRHTFCSNMAKSGMNPKTLQYIMGHSDIGVTLNTYTHLQFDDVKKEMKKVCNE